jgi:hypothetical protein
MILLALLAACTPGAPAPPEGAVPFPHPDDFRAPEAHGALALSVGAGSCQTCHREDGSAAPTCASCHGWPHPAGWLAGAVHGAGLTGTDGTAREPCLRCHDRPGLVATTDRSCTGCHPSYPHPAGWTQPTQHGTFALARGSVQAACAGCHGDALQGTATAPACATCHPSYPHSPGWEQPAAHGAASEASPGACVGCHGAGGTGGDVAVACSQCHATYPHPPDQLTAHIATADRVGEAVCAGCHAAASASTVPMPAACGSRCHGGAP